jgi:hypothetical protein
MSNSSSLRLLDFPGGFPGDDRDDDSAYRYPAECGFLGGGRSGHPGRPTGKEEVMKFHNPWIDPRVTQVRPVAAQAYLRTHAWQPLPVEQANLLPFTKGSGENDSPILQVPLLEQARDYPQRVVELITDLALAEGRYAVDVLNDILQQGMPDAVRANGPAVTGKSEPALK